MLEKIDTLEKARLHKFKYTMDEVSKGPSQEKITAVHLGSYDYSRADWEEMILIKEIFAHAMSELPPIRIVPWKDIKPLIDNKQIMTFGQMHHNSNNYHRYLHEGWTAALRDDHPIGGGSMDFKNAEGEYVRLSSVSDHPDCNILNDEEENSLNSVYYHSAKGHWLVNNIQKEGLRQPIQGHTNKPGAPTPYRLSIHPGSIRSKVFETMDEPHFETIVTDYADLFPHIPAMSVDEMLEYWKDLGSKSLTAVFTLDGKIEFSGDIGNHSGINFRTEVHDFNKKVTKLCKRKPVNIYLGYDSSHSEVFEVAKNSILESVNKNRVHGTCHEFFNDYQVEVKKLDINAIPEYTRDYANQSTEFTYSRFLIPYLENYEGFSFFIDDDYIWKHSPMSLFYFLDPDHALACVQYDFTHHDETKMDGEKNVSYPRKLWSSMMIFNNGHEDCRKLTPEVINTASGQFLHQFEWTNQISKIPHGKIATEGYDKELLETHHAVHFTRGGPWIKGMDCEHINMLDEYRKYKNRLSISN